MTPPPPPGFVVYADFNCPFCYALDLRLADLDSTLSIDWRPVEHAPEAGGASCGVDELAEIAAEVYTVRHRAPEVTIRLPGVRPRTAAANRIWSAVARVRPDAAPALRTALYRALWVEGRDLGDPRVLHDVLRRQGLAEVEATSEDDARLLLWHREWADGPFDRRIPSMQGPGGQILLGLSAPPDIRDFLEGERRLLQSSGVCSFVPRPVLLVVGDPRPVWPLLDRVAGAVQLLIAADLDGARMLMERTPPDLILRVVDAGDAEVTGLARSLHETAPGGDCPLIVLDLNYSSQRAWQAVRSGATDSLDGGAPHDLTERRLRERLTTGRKLARLRARERLDGLCRVPARREFERLFEQEWQRGLRSKMPLSLALVDVDDFGPLNKQQGHPHGDACLQGAASALASAVLRPADVVCRYGGDEFVLLLPDTGVDAARRVLDRCHASVRTWAEGFAEATGGPVVTVSMGISALRPTPDDAPQTLLRAADRALRTAKAGGRDRAEVELL